MGKKDAVVDSGLVDVNYVNSQVDTPLRWAVRRGDTGMRVNDDNIVKFLIQGRASLVENTAGNAGRSENAQIIAEQPPLTGRLARSRGAAAG